MNMILLFLVLQLVNVILSTIKSLLTVKGNKWHAVIANGIYFGYYTFIIKAIGDTDNFVVFGVELNGTLVMAIITVITNFIGVYFSLTLLEKLRKDKLWLLKVTIKSDEAEKFIKDLVAADISFIVLSSNWIKIKPIDIYLYNKEETKKCRSIMKQYESVKYCIIEADETPKL